MKSVIITGTSKGIGLETALAFARAGYKVFATMRNPEKAIALKQKIKDEALDITTSVHNDEDWFNAVQNSFGLNARLV